MLNTDAGGNQRLNSSKNRLSNNKLNSPHSSKSVSLNVNVPHPPTQISKPKHDKKFNPQSNIFATHKSDESEIRNTMVQSFNQSPFVRESYNERIRQS